MTDRDGGGDGGVDRHEELSRQYYSGKLTPKEYIRRALEGDEGDKTRREVIRRLKESIDFQP